MRDFNEVSEREELRPARSNNRMVDRLFITFGSTTLLFFLIFFAGSRFLPPVPPSFSPELTTDRYVKNQDGMKAGIYLVVISSILWPLYSVGIGNQMLKIEGINPNILSLQISSGSAAGFSLALISVFFATTMYRLDRDPTQTQLLSDLSWLCFTLVATPFATQEFAISYSILSDRRPDPLIPHWVAWVNSLLTLTWFPAYAAHCVHSGAIAWDGAVGFWLPLASLGIQVSLVSLYCWIVAGTKCVH